MIGDDRSDAAADGRSQAAIEGPPSGDTLSTPGLLSRRSTDFGLVAEGDVPAPDALLGRELGDVVIERLVAQGGMGRVYVARQRSPARAVAVKVMHPGRRTPAALVRFRREAELLGRLRHPGIAQVHLAGSCTIDGEETPFFVMEFVADAEPLVQGCDRRGFDVRRRLEIFSAVCDALGHAHAAGVVHRDLKPGNILLDAEGHPKVIDFGIARLTDDAEPGCTETGEFLGTRRYTSPEQCDGGVIDARTDVHALGVVLHELLTGRLPYDLVGRSLAETARILRDSPAAALRLPDPQLGPGLTAIAAACLAKRPADRYPSAHAVADDVRRLLAGRPLVARLPGPFAKARGWLQRHATPVAGGLTVALTVLAVTAAVVLPRWDRESWPPLAAGTGPKASFPNVSSLRTTPLQWLTVWFDEPVRSLSTGDFRLQRDGVEVSLEGVTVAGERNAWEIRGLERATAAGGRYVLELAGTSTTPVDFAGRRLAEPARTAWRMPPFEEIAFNLLGDDWRTHVVSMTDVECATERNAGRATFIRPTIPDREGAIVMRFEAPFEIRAASLEAAIAVWTTGDPFPYDPRAFAALDVSPDGGTWTNLDTREANRGGFGGGPFDIKGVVAGAREVWVRARLRAAREWPEDGLIHAQFLRSDPVERRASFRLLLSGPDPDANRPPAGTPAADG